MDQKAEIYIYGICDKTGPCETYSKFFSELKDAKDELKKYVNSLKEDLGMFNIKIQNDKGMLNGTALVLIKKFKLN